MANRTKAGAPAPSNVLRSLVERCRPHQSHPIERMEAQLRQADDLSQSDRDRVRRVIGSLRQCVPLEERPPLHRDDLAETLERAPKIIRAFESQIGQGEELLIEPACEHRCPVCVRECAIRKIMADWWRKELVTAEAQIGSAFTHNGTIYAEPEGSC